MRDAAGRETFIGRRFGRLTVVGDHAVGGSDRLVSCDCDCGATYIVAARRLANGEKRSCGRCRDGARNEELAARLEGIRAAVGALLPDLGTVGHALIVLTGCAPEVLNALESAGGLRVTRDDGVDLCHFDGPRVSIRVNAKGSPTT